MKIAILSRSPKCYSTKRLKETILSRHHQVRILDTDQFSIYVKKRRPELFYKGKPVPHFDAIIPRIGPSITFFGTAAVRQFEQMGVCSLNSSHSIAVARDKLRALQVLSRHDIGIPPSAFVKSKFDVLPAIQEIGGAPVVIKLLEGTQGIGVILAETENVAEAIIETLQSAKQQVLIQKFVAESKGRDIRAFVVGDKVVAAMRRIAQGSEYRSNVHRGGLTEKVRLSREYELAAVKAAHILGLNVAGVDILESSSGPQVMEVNSSPGLEGIEQATGVDVASEIVQFLEEQINFPEVDLRQKLTLGKGYEIVEVPISTSSELANKTIRENQLKDREILVLSINRNNVLLPSPKSTTVILPGDELLCYGKRLALKTLVPKKSTQRVGKNLRVQGI